VSRIFVRVWFCLAVAVVAAAIADPIVEAASNAGLFGPGNFTDHSNLDVGPALLTGIVFALCYLVMRATSALSFRPSLATNALLASHRALQAGLPKLLPLAFGVQIGVLYIMETAEQYSVYGHLLGGTVWLGAPIFVSLAVHAAFCALTGIAIARAVRSLAEVTLRIIRAFVTYITLGIDPAIFRRAYVLLLVRCASISRHSGERAPPPLKAF
jgi:hypothetical protein